MNEITDAAPATDTCRLNAAGAALLVAGATLATAALTPRPARAAVNPPLTFNDIPGTGDVKVLNYALALEALEADLYAQALLRLTGGGTNALGTAITGLGLSTSEPDVKYTAEFGTVEAQHRDFLNGALGSQSILTTALAGARFDFGMQSLSRQQVVDLLYTAENLGTQAYLGAIKLFATKTYLLQAGGIQSTEARHTAVIAAVFNTLVGRGAFSAALKKTAPLAGDPVNINGATNTAGIDSTAEPNDVLATVSPFIVPAG
jgi:hypothetical protein